MSLNDCIERSQGVCELCQSDNNLSIYTVESNFDNNQTSSIYCCQYCRHQITGAEVIDTQHWRHLSDLMWSSVPAIQVLSYRLLHQIEEPWARDALDMLYLDDALIPWAQEALVDKQADSVSDHKPTLDSNGSVLLAGDNVTLIKDLTVKGAGFTAKRGTVVRNISLTDNPLHVEGRVNGVRIVLVSDFLKKA